MRNATSMESSGRSPAGSLADLQDARRVCSDLGRQGETVAELVVPLLRQATQELSRLEAQREELRKPGAREAQQNLLPRLTERIEEQSQNVKRLERASRGIKELLSALGGLGELLQGGLARRDEELRELEAITREEKRMWLRELHVLREQVGGQESPGSLSPVQQGEQQRLRSENEALPKLRAEHDRLAQRVAELEENLLAREQALTAKEQTIEDLRRMIVLLTGDAASPASPKQPAPRPPTPRSLPDPVHLVPRTPTKVATPPKQPSQMFGSSTMQLANNLLESLGMDTPVSAPPVAEKPEPPIQRAPSMEIMLGPLDELEPPPPSLPPPVPNLPPVPSVPTMTPASAMPKASARHPSSGPAKTPPPVPASAPRVVGRPPGTLVISEDMFNEMLIEDSTPGGSDRK